MSALSSTDASGGEPVRVASQLAPNCETRLAPPLPPPPADLRLLTAASLLLVVALALVWAAAARLRRRPQPDGGRRQLILNELAELRLRVPCACRHRGAAASSPAAAQDPLPTDGRALNLETDRGERGNAPALPRESATELDGPCLQPQEEGRKELPQCPCAHAVHRLLADFAAMATGLPCTSMTTQELRTCERQLPAARRDAFARLLEVMAAADLDRFSPRPPPIPGLCLVDAAVAAVRGWPGEPTAESTPDGSTERS